MDMAGMVRSKSSESFWIVEDNRNEVFKKFLVKGFIRFVWYNRAEWAYYAWMSPLKTAGLVHLMRSIRDLSVYWIFYHHVRDEQ